MSEIPVIDLSSPNELVSKNNLEAIRTLKNKALESSELIRSNIHRMDKLARNYLKRTNNPFLYEMELIAEYLGDDAKGIFGLNLVYDFACTTCVGEDRTHGGNKMVRIFDWDMPYIAPFTAFLKYPRLDGHPYYAVSWLGYSGVLTAMVPGKFSVSINKPPKDRFQQYFGTTSNIITRFYGKGDTSIPPEHYLRRVCAEAKNYAHAKEMLYRDINLFSSAIFTLSGIKPDEGCVVEARGRKRHLPRQSQLYLDEDYTPTDPLSIGTANAWANSDNDEWYRLFYKPGFHGKPRPYYKSREDKVSYLNGGKKHEHKYKVDTNKERLKQGFGMLNEPSFISSDKMPSPLLNYETVLIAWANAKNRTLCAEAIGGVERTINGECVNKGDSLLGPTTITV